jgi:hypothetical protein
MTVGLGGGLAAGSESYTGNSGKIIIRENTFIENEGWFGGGAYIRNDCEGNTQGDTIIDRNIFRNNIGVWGGGLRVYQLISAVTGGNVVISNNIVVNNHAIQETGGVNIYESTGSSARTNFYILNNTIADNTCDVKNGGMKIGFKGEVRIYNNIIWNNTDSTTNNADDVWLMDDGGTSYGYNNDYSVLLGSWDHSGDNISSIPEFVGSGDYHLQDVSQCIDAGTNSAPNLPAEDFDGDQRIVDGDDDGTAIVDIGADEFGFVQKDDILGTWASGVWFRDSEADLWVNLSSQAGPIAAGDLDGDGIADLIGVWSGSGVWVRYSATGGWAKLSSPPLPVDITCGDVNGGGRDDLVGSWPSGTFYRDTLGGGWNYVTSKADVLACGDLDGDGTDDVIGVWSNGLWVKYSSSGSWARLDSHPPDDIACGDMNGDGRDDVLGTWSAYGTFYRDTLGGSWAYVSTPADLVAAGDLDGDGVDDLIGTWSGACIGLWVKYSATMSWKKISLSVPSDIDAGLFRDGVWDAVSAGYREPIGGYPEGPGSSSEYEDVSDAGLSGWDFVYQEGRNLVPLMSEAEELKRIPGPGEPGFTYIEQENLEPMEELISKKKE